MNIQRYRHHERSVSIVNKSDRQEHRLSGSMSNSSEFMTKTERILEKARTQRRSTRNASSTPKQEASAKSKPSFFRPIHNLPIAAPVVPSTLENRRRSNVNCSRDTKNVIAEIVCRDRSPTYSYCMPPPDSRAHNDLCTQEDQERARTSNNLAAFDALPDTRSTQKKYLDRHSKEKRMRNGSSSSVQRDESSTEEVHQLLNELKICNQKLAKCLVQMKLREDCNAEMADDVIYFLKTCDGVFGRKGISKLIVNDTYTTTAGNRFAIDALLKRGENARKNKTNRSSYKMKKVTFGQEVDKTSEFVRDVVQRRRSSELVSILRNSSGVIPRSVSK